MPSESAATIACLVRPRRSIESRTTRWPRRSQLTVTIVRLEVL